MPMIDIDALSQGQSYLTERGNANTLGWPKMKCVTRPPITNQ